MKTKALIPNYFDKFKCVGSDCRYTCCQEWNINLTKNDYMRVKKFKKSPDLQSLIDSSYKRDKKSMSDDVYGYINMSKNEFCPMFSDDGLCLLQLECGHTALCEVCKTFPRDYSVISGDTVECGLSPACEEVARLLIEQTEPIIFDNVDEFEMTTSVMSVSKPSKPQPLHEYYWDIKTLCIAVLQADEYSLGDRLLILGVALKSITEMEVAKIPAYVDSLLNSDDLDYLVSSFKDIEVNSTIALGKFAEVIKPITDNKNYKESAETAKALLSKIAQADGTSLKLDVVALEAKRAQFEQFTKKYPRALENLLVAVVTSKSLPFYEGSVDIWKGYVYLVMLYNLYKHTILTVMEEDVGINTVTDSIAWVSRCVVHNYKYRAVLLGSYEANESYSLAHMAMIIKG